MYVVFILCSRAAFSWNRCTIFTTRFCNLSHPVIEMDQFDFTWFTHNTLCTYIIRVNKGGDKFNSTRFTIDNTVICVYSTHWVSTAHEFCRNDKPCRACTRSRNFSVSAISLWWKSECPADQYTLLNGYRRHRLGQNRWSEPSLKSNALRRTLSETDTDREIINSGRNSTATVYAQANC